MFTTAEDNQPSVEIHVLQGEREMAMYNKTLGKFQLVDLPPAPRGMPQIEVTFDIDANGIVHVSAQDKATGKEQSMTITGQSSLAKDDIERMVRDAEAHAEDDRRRREEAEVRNTADTLVYQTEKLLKEQGEKFEGSEKDDVEVAPCKGEGRAGRHRRGGHQGRHRDAGGGEPELHPAALRAGLASASAGPAAAGRVALRAAPTPARAGPTTRSWTPRSSTSHEPSPTRRPARGGGSPVGRGAGRAPEHPAVEAPAARRRRRPTTRLGRAVWPREADLAPTVARPASGDEYLLRAPAHAGGLRELPQASGELQQEEQSAARRRGPDRQAVPVLDALDLAEAHQSESLGRATTERCCAPHAPCCSTCLSKEGLERVDQAEVPSTRRCTTPWPTTEGDGDERGEALVDQVLRSGYRWKGQVLRAAMVRVRG